MQGSTTGENTMSLTGKVAIVTGGGSGVGAAVTAAFAAVDVTVAVFDIDQESAIRVTTETEGIGGRAEYWPVDVADADAVASAVNAVAHEFGRIDILCNSAAVPTQGTVLETAPDQWRQTLGVNLDGPYLCSREVIPHMLEGDGGSIVNIASVQGLASLPDSAAYVASKGGLIALTRAMAVDHSPQIRVNCIAPGSVRTPMLLRGATQLNPDDPEQVIAEWGRAHPMGRVVEPEEVAEAAVFLASDRSSMITGECVVVDGGLLARLAL